MSSTKATPAVKKKNELGIRAHAKKLACGFVSGIAQAFAFNFWDRALYLSVKVS
jgi:hypothetical protein